MVRCQERYGRSDLKTNTIVTLVMINGAEIIGRFVDESDTHITLYKPRMVQATQQGVGLVNGISMTGKEPNDNFSFSRHSILYMLETVSELSNGWTQQTSGIQLPTKGIV